MALRAAGSFCRFNGAAAHHDEALELEARVHVELRAFEFAFVARA